MNKLYYNFVNSCGDGNIEQVKSIINNNKLQLFTLLHGFSNAAIHNNKNNIDIIKYIFNYTQINNMKMCIGISDVNLLCKLITIVSDISIEIMKYIVYLNKHNYNYCINTDINRLSECDLTNIYVIMELKMEDNLLNNIEFNNITRNTHIIYCHKNITSNILFSICNHITNIYILNNNSVCSSCINNIICNTNYIFTINRDDVYDE